MNLGDIASQIYEEEFEGTSGTPTSGQISGWLSGHVGDVNNLLYTDFAWSGDFYSEEASIFKALYLKDFYKKQAGAASRGIINGGASSSLLSVKEGDSAISFVNRNEVSKGLMSLSKQYSDDLKDLVANYQIYQAYPRQTQGVDAYYLPNSCEPYYPTGYLNQPPFGEEILTIDMNILTDDI